MRNRKKKTNKQNEKPRIGRKCRRKGNSERNELDSYAEATLKVEQNQC